MVPTIAATKVEIEGLKRACKRDSIALVQVLSSLEKQLAANGGSATLQKEFEKLCRNLNSLLLNMTHL
jgi:Xaa-Pro aminopeptidase